MRNLIVSGLSAAAILLSFSPAAVAQPTSQISDAIALCRTAVAEQANVAIEHVRLDQVRQRSRSVSVDVDLWVNGRLTNVRCDVARGETLSIASITPALGSTATAQR